MSGYGFGPELMADGVTFRLWAPAAKSVELVTDRAHRMVSQAEGWHTFTLVGARAGTRYRFRIDGELDVPDPASAFQPEDVTGPSEVIDHAPYPWRAADWRGRPWEEAAILELHVGAFTPEGTFRAAIDKLDHVVEAGFTAIELMPLADFAGRRNWGYDGVLLYAPDSVYGRPDDLRALIDAAHARGLMVFLDVVYNHFGPEGNYLGRYAPAFFEKGSTPWGQAIDYRVPQVRAFAIENALHWLDRYRVDGLRLDAVQTIIERGEPSVLAELSRAAGALARRSGRHIHLVIENDDNAARLLDPRAAPTAGKFRAQWNDDYHHAWHVLLTGETHGYYADHARTPLARVARVLGAGFDYQGEPSMHRGGRRRGERSGALPPTAFIDFLQNHDQVGNRAFGDRLDALAQAAAVEAALAVTLLAPMPPMMFMGEEWGATTPFPFFCDFRGALAEAVRKGRRAEFKGAYARRGDHIPDPLAETTFRAAKLDWSESASEAGRKRLALVRDLMRVRREKIMPLLAEIAFDPGTCSHGAILRAAWSHPRGRLRLLANISAAPARRPDDWANGAPIWGGDPGATLPPWSVFWSMA